MRRGEVYWADFGPPAHRRPAVIVTRGNALRYLTSVTVAPVSTRIRDVPSEVRIGHGEGLRQESAINCFAVTTISKERLDPEPVGRLGLQRILELDRALRFSLEIRS